MLCGTSRTSASPSAAATYAASTSSGVVAPAGSATRAPSRSATGAQAAGPSSGLGRSSRTATRAGYATTIKRGRLPRDDDRGHGRVREVRRPPRRGARRPRAQCRRAGRAAALLPLPPRPDDPVDRGRAARRVPPAHPARARGVPHDHDPRPADRRRRRGGLRVPRGVHPRLHQGVRRPAVRLAPQARAPPDRGAQRRPLPPTRQPPAAGERPGDPDGTPHEDGRAPRLADRRDGPRRGTADR